MDRRKHIHLDDQGRPRLIRFSRWSRGRRRSDSGKPVDFSSIATCPTGAVVVAWQTSYGGAKPWDTTAQLYNSSGTAVYATPITVNTYLPNSELSPSVAMRWDGSFLVAWQAVGEDGSGNGVYAQAFDPTGARIGGELPVNTTTAGGQQDPAVAWRGNNAVVTWDGNGAGDANGIFLQQYVASGATNVSPVNVVPTGAATYQDTPLAFSSAHGNAISTSDADANGGVEQVSLTASNGTFALSGTSGLTFTTGDGTSSAAMTFSGTLANVNAALNGLVFTPASNFTGAAGMTLVVDDLGNTGGGGAKTASSTISINVQSPPSSDVVPGGQTTIENTALVFSPANANAFYLSGSDNYIELTVTHGALTLSTTSGLTFGNSTANGQSSLVFSGTKSAMVAALNGLRYTPTANYVGSDTLTLITTNSGLLGLGLLGSSSTYTVPLTVTATPAHVNQAPTIVAPRPRRP